MAPAIGKKTRKMMEQYAKPYRPEPYTPLVPPLPEGRHISYYFVGKFVIGGGWRDTQIYRVILTDDVVLDEAPYSKTVYLTSVNDGSVSFTIETLDDMIGRTFYTDLRDAQIVAERNRQRREQERARRASLDAARTSGTSP